MRQPLDHLTLAKVGTQEEMGELQQVIGKIDRFGLRSEHPVTGETNIEALAGEIGDVLGALYFYVEQMSVTLPADESRRFLDQVAIRQYGKKPKLIDYNERRGGEGA